MQAPDVAGRVAPDVSAPPSDPVAAALHLVSARVGDAVGGSGEPIAVHASGMLSILSALKVDESTRVAAVLFGVGGALSLDEIGTSFGEDVRRLVDGMRQLLRLKEAALRANQASSSAQLETLRRMTLAMATDIRVVLLRLASRLQTLRWSAQTRRPPDGAIAHETLEVLAPLANRLGLGQLKWELEDLAFRFLEPDLYRSIAKRLEERRVERERFVHGAIERLRAELAAQGLAAEVTGRPKHIHSIYSKMRTKGLGFDQIQDLRAFRVLVGDVKDCYMVLGTVHQIWPPIPREFDDYISRPKANGYQSLHTVVTAEDGRPLEVQIRTRAMHRHAEFGVASHWRYKEGSSVLSAAPDTDAAGGAGRRTSGRGRAALTRHDEQIEWMRQLLMWQQEVGATLGGGMDTTTDLDDARIFLLTPEARVVELPAGSTPIDFAYHVHTALGHRCRGAKVDRQMVPLNTVLRNGQTVEIVTARAGIGADGPSRDWLNPQLGFVRSARARAKVRQWFNAQELARDVATGRDRVERMLQREGRTALGLDEVARRLAFQKPDDLFVAVARDEVGPRALEDAIRGIGEGEPSQKASPGQRPPHSDVGHVQVVGVDDLLTQLARCCRPAPPDPILGFVTKGRGVSVHRIRCASFAEMARRAPERVLQTAWSDRSATIVDSKRAAVRASYPVDVVLRARDRQGLLRDVSDVFVRDRLNVVAVRTASRGGVAHMEFTVEVPGVSQLDSALVAVRGVDGVIEARRK